jgi:hypothetical protein
MHRWPDPAPIPAALFKRKKQRHPDARFLERTRHGAGVAFDPLRIVLCGQILVDAKGGSSDGESKSNEEKSDAIR